MSVLVTFTSNIDDLDVYERGHSTEELTAGLPTAPEKRAASSQPAPTCRCTSPEIIREMLRHIDPGLSRNEAWLIVCGGMVSAPVDDADWYEKGLDLFTKWSRGDLHGGTQPQNFRGADDCQAQWDRDWEAAHG